MFILNESFVIAHRVKEKEKERRKAGRDLEKICKEEKWNVRGKEGEGKNRGRNQRRDRKDEK